MIGKSTLIAHEGSNMNPFGYFGIGIEHSKTEHNIGTLWRSASILGASFIFTVGRRYCRQSSDTTKTWKRIPLFHFDTMEDLKDHLPFACPLVGVELHTQAQAVVDFIHHDNCCYILGAEDQGLTAEALGKCHAVVQLPGIESMNVASAGTIIMYDRLIKKKLVDTLLKG